MFWAGVNREFYLVVTMTKTIWIMTSMMISTLLLVGFSASPNSFAAIDSVGGNVVEITPPADVSEGVLEDNTDVIIFQEKENYVLENDVDVEITEDGIHNSANPGLSPATLSTGNVVNSYYIHADKVGSNNNFISFSGSVTFDNDIIGVIIYDDKLDASDVELGAAGTTYDATDVNRGLDWIVNPSGNPDSFTISGNTLTVNNFRVANVQDAIRVITVGIPLVTEVEIDVKPGSDPSSWNCKNAKGGVPVAIFSSPDFDAATIDLSTLTIDGIPVSEVHEKKGEPKRHLEDRNGDGLDDAILHLGSAEVCKAAEDIDLKQTGYVLFEGSTIEGDMFEGIGDIRIVKR